MRTQTGLCTILSFGTALEFTLKTGIALTKSNKKKFRISLFDVLGVVAVLVMVWSLYSLVRRYGTGFGELDIEVTQDELEAGFREGYEYHSLYLGAAKVGTLRSERRRNVGGGYRMTTEMELSVSTGLFTQRTRSNLVADLDAEFRLSSFQLDMSGGVLNLSLEGRWDGEAIVVTGLPGDSSARRFELPEPPLIMPSLRPVLMRRNLREGDRLSLSYYDPMSQAPVAVDIAFIGHENIELMGRTVEAFHFEEIALGHRNQVWVNALGEVLIEELPMGFKAVREPEAEARYGLNRGESEEPPHITSQVLDQVVDNDLQRPRWTSAHLQLRAPGGLVLPTDEQAVRKLQEDVIAVDITRAKELPKAARLQPRELEKLGAYLVDTLTLQSSSTAVRIVSREVMERAERSTWDTLRVDQRVDALVSFVATDLELVKGSQERFESSEGVLDARRGSALGKAYALVALLRAQGIPSRLVHGMVLVGSSLVRHVWVDVYLNQWVDVDPTFGQSPADAGHIRLGEGGQVERFFAQGVMTGVELLQAQGK